MFNFNLNFKDYLFWFEYHQLTKYVAKTLFNQCFKCSFNSYLNVHQENSFQYHQKLMELLKECNHRHFKILKRVVRVYLIMGRSMKFSIDITVIQKSFGCLKANLLSHLSMFNKDYLYIVAVWLNSLQIKLLIKLTIFENYQLYDAFKELLVILCLIQLVKLVWTHQSLFKALQNTLCTFSFYTFATYYLDQVAITQSLSCSVPSLNFLY